MYHRAPSTTLALAAAASALVSAGLALYLHRVRHNGGKGGVSSMLGQLTRMVQQWRGPGGGGGGEEDEVADDVPEVRARGGEAAGAQGRRAGRVLAQSSGVPVAIQKLVGRSCQPLTWH